MSRSLLAKLPPEPPRGLNYCTYLLWHARHTHTQTHVRPAVDITTSNPPSRLLSCQREVGCVFLQGRPSRSLVHRFITDMQARQTEARAVKVIIRIDTPLRCV